MDNGLQFNSAIGAFNLGGLAGGNLLTLADTSGAAVTLNVGGNGASTTYSGAIGGSGGLTKVGLGTLTLLGSKNVFWQHDGEWRYASDCRRCLLSPTQLVGFNPARQLCAGGWNQLCRHREFELGCNASGMEPIA